MGFVFGRPHFFRSPGGDWSEGCKLIPTEAIRARLYKIKPGLSYTAWSGLRNDNRA
jgi:hypothetical protein